MRLLARQISCLSPAVLVCKTACYLLIALMVLGGITSPAQAKRVEWPQLNILADPSLSLPLSIIARHYAKEHQMVMNLSYAGSNEQKMRIMEGMEADLFITPRIKTLQSLKNQGLVDVYSETSVTKGRLVLATRADNPVSFTLIQGLPLRSILAADYDDFSLVLHDPEFIAAGTFAMQALRNYGLDGEMEPHFMFVQSLMDVQQVLEQKGMYGIVLNSEVVGNSKLRVVDTFPENAHDPLLFRGVVVASEHMEDARKFLDYLQSPTAQAIFKSHGFFALN